MSSFGDNPDSLARDWPARRAEQQPPEHVGQLVRPKSGSQPDPIPRTFALPVLAHAAVDRHPPVIVAALAPTNDVVVVGLDGSRDRADLSGADDVVVDRDDAANFRAGATKEHLVGDVQLGAVDLAFESRNLQDVPTELEDALASDTLENPTGETRSDRDAVSDDEKAGRGAFGDLSLR